MAGRGRPKKTTPPVAKTAMTEDKVKKDGTVSVRKVPPQRVDIRMKWKVTDRTGTSWEVLGPIGLIYQSKIKKPGYKGPITKVERV